MLFDAYEKYSAQFCRCLFQLLIFLIMAFLLVGCLPGALKILISDGRTGVAEFIIERTSGNCGEEEGALIQSIWFGRAQDNGRDLTIWYLRSIDAQGHSIHSLEYGVVPIGFYEVEKIKQPLSGGNFDAKISGNGCSGSINFSIK
jgi:hypothetical protein